MEQHSIRLAMIANEQRQDALREARAARQLRELRRHAEQQRSGQRRWLETLLDWLPEALRPASTPHPRWG